MDLRRLLTDDAYVETPDGTRSGPFKTKFGTHELVFYESGFHVDDGDHVIQVLPSGKEKKHYVTNMQHSSGMHGIPPNFIVTVEDRKPGMPNSSTHNYNISGTNVQVGNHNAQHITTTFQTLISEIDASSFSTEEKQEAKSKLRAFLESPVAAAVLGGAAQGVLSILGAG